MHTYIHTYTRIYAYTYIHIYLMYLNNNIKPNIAPCNCMLVGVYKNIKITSIIRKSHIIIAYTLCITLNHCFSFTIKIKEKAFKRLKFEEKY